MMDDRRNPYVILGIPYGASRGEARRAVARRNRELRQRSDVLYSAEDINWALHQVEKVIDDPEAGVDVFRVPAASGILDAPSGHGLFHPDPVLLPRKTGPITDEEFEQLRHDAVAVVAKKVIGTLGPHVPCWPPH